MLKLSRTGWNNVIIITVMAFILLINTTFKHKFSSEEVSVNGEQPVIIANAVILTLSIHDAFKVERVGKNWRSSSSLMNENMLDQMMMAWEQRTGTVMESAPDIDTQMALTVVVDLANIPEPITLSLYATDTDFLIYNNHFKYWLRLPLPIFSQLIPDEVFASE